MSTNIEIFKNKEFGQVRTMLIGKEPWFVGKDVAGILGYVNTRDALAKHVDNEDRTDGVAIRDSIGREQKVTVINESGLYALIFGSKLESAKRFKHWVTSEVLPAIRKTGTYSAVQEQSVPALPVSAEQKLIDGDETVQAYNRGIVLGVLRQELEQDSALEIFNRLSARGKGIVMKMIFGEVPYAK